MLRTVAIDDEPLALQLVVSYINQTPFLDLVGSFTNPLEALTFLQENEVDFVLLDIRMPDLSGTKLAALLKDGPKVVFTTAYQDYAIEGYKLDVVDYLVKPFSYESFLGSAIKVKERLGATTNKPVVIEGNSDFLFIKSDYKVRRINLSDILYLEGLKDYVKVFMVGQPKPLLSQVTMKQLETKLPADKFMRVHKSFIVNLNKIEIIERNRIVFGQEYIPVGDQFKSAFQEWVDKNFL